MGAVVELATSATSCLHRAEHEPDKRADLRRLPAFLWITEVLFIFQPVFVLLL